MAKEFKLPDLGENIESADVLNVLVKPGDNVELDQPVIEIETDKATIEVPSTVEGTIKEVLVKSGETIKVGQAIITIEDGQSSGAGKQEVKAEAGTAAEAPKAKEEKSEIKKNIQEEKAPPVLKKPEGQKGTLEFKLPDLGENIESADVINVLVKAGDKIERDQAVLEIETDKATIEVPSTVDGVVTEVLIKAGEKAKVGQTLLKVESPEGASVPEEKPAPAAAEAKRKEETKEEKKPEPDAAKGEKESFAPGEIENQPPIVKGAAPAAPSVRRIAREIGVDINQVPGTGPRGRISMDDVKAFSKKLHESRGTAAGGSAGLGIKAEKLPDFTKFGEVERKPMSNVRAKTAEHLSFAWAAIPHVTQHDKADITELENLRKSFNPKVEKSGGKLTVTAILIKVLTAAMKVYPQFNSSIDMEKKEIIYKKYYNVGIAVDTEHGLIVPVVKDTDKKNLVQLSVEMNVIAEKARNRKIGLEDLQGAGMTITNLGGIGGTSFTPIVNSPEVAILGVSRGSFEPVYNKETGKFQPRLMLPLSLSYDHRIIDGADAARFLRWVCEALEQPFKLLIEG
jgi:pyruvate dehydrogenase E2 component (dihydrolipoamide acetyltransferase)